jgi:short subunit dehydrogenase-like uncharacterized protein
MKARNWLHGIFIHWLLIVGGILLVSVAPLRSFLKKRVYQPGEGAKREDTAKDELEYRGIAYPDSEKAAGKAAFCRMWYHGGMYFCKFEMQNDHELLLTVLPTVTGMLLAEIAATILEDDIELDGGSYTPACLGQGLVDRLDKSGFRTDVKIIDA